MYTYIYIHIQRNGCNLTWWAPKWPKPSKIPTFIVKIATRNSHKNRGGFFLGGFLFFNVRVFFPCDSYYLLLFYDILNPQDSPPNEVIGAEASFSAYLFAHLKGKNSNFWPFWGKNGGKRKQQRGRPKSVVLCGRKAHFFPSLKQMFAQKVGRQWGLGHIYIYIYMGIV